MTAEEREFLEGLEELTRRTGITLFDYEVGLERVGREGHYVYEEMDGYVGFLRWRADDGSGTERKDHSPDGVS